jgi:hypothetical protein
MPASAALVAEVVRSGFVEGRRGLRLDQLSGERAAGTPPRADLSASIEALAGTAPRALAAGKRLRAEYAGRASQSVPVTISALTSGGSAQETTLGSVSGTGTTLTKAAHGLGVGQAVRFDGRTGLPFLNGGVYYVRNVLSADTFEVYASNGTSGGPADTGGNGGTATLVTGMPTTERFWNRTASAINTAVLVTETRGVQRGPGDPQWDLIYPDPTIIDTGTGTPSSTAIACHTLYEGSKIDVLFYNNGTGQTTVYVDGLLIDTVTTTQLAAAGIGGGSTGRKTYTFPSAARRRITVRHSSAALAGLARQAPYPLIYPSGFDKGARVVFEGDSFVEGTGANTTGVGYVEWVARLMGWPDVWRAGSGGTGYRSAGDNRKALKDRKANVTSQAGNIVVLAMGINDAALDTAAVTADATGVWDHVTTNQPAAELVIIGPWPNGGGNGGIQPSLIALDVALRDAALMRGLRYISPIGEGWTFPVAGGGDTTHPSDAGHEILGYRVAGHLAVPFEPIV